MCRSVPQIEAAWTRTRISASPGSGMAMSSRSAPGSGAVLRSARIENSLARARRFPGQEPPRAFGPSKHDPTDGGRMSARRIGVAIAAVAILASACGRLNDDGPGAGGSGPSGGSGTISHPTGADDLVLRVEYQGGFVAPEYLLSSVPFWSLYGDGTLILTGPQIEIYPPPALPPLLRTPITEDGVQAILAAAKDAGLMDGDKDFGQMCIADAATTVFTTNANGRTSVVSAYALDVGVAIGGSTGPSGASGGGTPGSSGVATGSSGSATGSSGLTGEASAVTGTSGGAAGTCGNAKDADARAALAAFQARLGDLKSWLPEGSVGQDEPYQPTEMRVYVVPYRADPELRQEPIDWPLDTPLSAFGEPLENDPNTRCGVISGGEFDQVFAAAQSANQLTPWVSEGTKYGLILRPLLPDEHTC